MAVYICKCGFHFERTSAEQCPACGGMNIRYSTDEEAEEYQRNREEADRAYSQEEKE